MAKKMQSMDGNQAAAYTSYAFTEVAGSISPHLVPIITPCNGVSPIDVSIHFPSLTADIDAPFPKWQTIIFECSGFPNAFIHSSETNL